MGDYEIKLDAYYTMYTLQEQSAKVQGKEDFEWNEPIIAGVWNPFAKLAGGKQINSQIPWEKADLSIQSYTQRIPLEESYSIAELLGFHKVTKEEAQQYDTNARNFLKELANNPDKITFEKENYSETDTTPGYCIRAKLPDGREAAFLFDIQGNKEKLVFVDVNFDTTPNFKNLETGETEDFSDTHYSSYENTMGYITPDGPNGDIGYTNSDGYQIGGVPFKEIEQLSKEILKYYKPE